MMVGEGVLINVTIPPLHGYNPCVLAKVIGTEPVRGRAVWRMMEMAIRNPGGSSVPHANEMHDFGAGVDKLYQAQRLEEPSVAMAEASDDPPHQAYYDPAS